MKVLTSIFIPSLVSDRISSFTPLESDMIGLIAKNHDFIQIFDLAMKSGPPWADCDQKPNPILCNYILLNIFDC